MDNPGTTTAIIPEARLFGKMAKVMMLINRVPKSGFNSFHKYKYATTDDVADCIREAMAEANLALFADMGEVRQELYEYETDGGKKKNTIRTTIHFNFTFACGDTGATRSSPWIGQVDDNSDKAVSKCATAAEKYFLMKTFIVSAGDEPDSDADKHMEDNPRKVTPAPQKLLEWHEKPDVINEMVNRAFKNEWIASNGDTGRMALETLIEPAKWSDFPGTKEAGQAIMEAIEQRSKTLPSGIVPAPEPDPVEQAAAQIPMEQAAQTLGSVEPRRIGEKPGEPHIREAGAVALVEGKVKAGASPFGSDKAALEMSDAEKTAADKALENSDIPPDPVNPNRRINRPNGAVKTMLMDVPIGD